MGGGMVFGGATVALGPDTGGFSSPAGREVVVASVAVLTVVGMTTAGGSVVSDGEVTLSVPVMFREEAVGGSVGLAVPFEGPCKEEIET